MIRLLRSIIDFGDLRAPKEALATNLSRLRETNLEFVRADERNIYQFVCDYATLNMGEVPSVATVQDFFERDEDYESKDWLDAVAKAKVYLYSDFRFLLKTIVEEQQEAEMTGVLKQAQEIIRKGYVVGEGRNKKRLKGITEALSYVNQRADEIVPAESGDVQTEGDARADTDKAWMEYLDAKHGQGTWGVITGIDHIDMTCRGAKKGDLWIHAGFPGELKSCFSMNMAYAASVRYRRNVLFCSLEMRLQNLRRGIYALHSTNPMYQRQGRKPLDYRRIRDGELSPEEEAHYKAVLDDYRSYGEHHRLHIWCPPTDVTIADIRRKAESLHKDWEVGLIVIDHGLLVKSTLPDRDYGVRMNDVVRAAKRLALQFEGGAGVPVLLPFQINREGKKEADKRDGRYSLSALSYTNEAEKSADVITTTYLNDDLRARGRTVCCNLKNRDNPLFEPVELGVDFGPRRIYQTGIAITGGNGIGIDEGEDLLAGLDI